MNMNCLKSLKFCHYILYGIAFVGLLFSCHFLYMNEAIEESKIGARALTKRSESIPYESPTIIVCPEPGFKPSISKKYNLNITTRDLFLPWMGDSVIQVIKEKFHSQTVKNLYEEFTYGNDDLLFLYENTYLKRGKNKVKIGNKIMDVELKILPTYYNGACFLIESKNVNNWNEKYAGVYFIYRFDTLHLNELE